jgi:hypothetical protein
MQRLIQTAALILLLASCASGPRIATQSNPAVDFSSMGTYNFMQPLGTDRANGVQTPLSNMLSQAVSREMSKRGFRRSDNPDLLVNLFVNTEQRLQVRQVPTAGSFHGYRRNRYRTWGSYRTDVREYTQGTLAIDLVDAGQNMLAWEGVAQQRLSRNAAGITQEQADEVINQVMAQFTHRAN